MLGEDRATDVVTRESAKGRMRMWTVAPGVFCTEASGHIEPDVGEALIEYTARKIAEQPARLHIFHDWRGLKGYDPGVRTRWVTWIGQRLKHYERVHIASTSTVLRMGATVANLALPNLIQVHDTLLPLEVELARITQERSR